MTHKTLIWRRVEKTLHVLIIYSELRLNLAQSCQGPQADTCGNVLPYPS